MLPPCPVLIFFSTKKLSGNVKLADSNIWLALLLNDHTHHEVVSKWFTLQPTNGVAFCRHTQLSLLRLLTSSAITTQYAMRPLTDAQAWDRYQEARSNPRVTLIDEPPNLEPVLQSLVRQSSPSPKLWMDAYLAAIAIAGGHGFVTLDRAFQQFPLLSLDLLRPTDLPPTTRDG